MVRERERVRGKRERGEEVGGRKKVTKRGIAVGEGITVYYIAAWNFPMGACLSLCITVSHSVCVCVCVYFFF